MTRTGVAAVDNLAACPNVVPIPGFHGIEEEFQALDRLARAALTRGRFKKQILYEWWS